MKAGDLYICKKDYELQHGTYIKGSTVLLTDVCNASGYRISHVWFLDGEKKRWLGILTFNELFELVSKAKEE